ncbi:MAG: hypothetical protein QXF26_09560 [Candidatus Bathyarchaeia archaeon]
MGHRRPHAPDSTTHVDSFPHNRIRPRRNRKRTKILGQLVPVEKQYFDELTNRAEDVLEKLGQGEPFPSENGIILVVDLTEVFRTGEG